MKYEILHKRDFWVLENEVNERLKQGWHLVGGVSAYPRDTIETYYTQAMLKEEE